MTGNNNADRGMGKYLTDAPKSDEPSQDRRTNEQMTEAHERAAVEANRGLGKYLLPPNG
jgi:hypothetical protein